MYCSSKRNGRLLIAACILLSFSPSAFSIDHPRPTGKETVLKSPYRYIGRLTFSEGGDPFQGTGTVISGKIVLTCAHVMFNKGSGFSTNFTFLRGKYGSSALSRNKPISATVMSGYRENVEKHGVADPDSFARDLAIIRFAESLAGGASAQWRQSDNDLLKPDLHKKALGYGSEKHSGNELLSSETDEPFSKVQSGYWFNYGNLLEGGMSGGPMFGKFSTGLKIIAVNVSGRDPNPNRGLVGLSGYRVLDQAGAKFIRIQSNRNPQLHE